MEGSAVECDERVCRGAEARRRRPLREGTDVGEDRRFSERPAVVERDRGHDGVGLLRRRVREAPPDEDHLASRLISGDVRRLVDALALAERHRRFPAVAVVRRPCVDDLRSVLLRVPGEHGVRHVNDSGRHLLNTRPARRRGSRVGHGEVVSGSPGQQGHRHRWFVDKPTRVGGRSGTFCDLDRILPRVREAALNRAFVPSAEQQRAGAIPVECNEAEEADARREPDDRVRCCLVPKSRRERRGRRRILRLEARMQVALPREPAVHCERRPDPRLAADVRAIDRAVAVHAAKHDQRIVRRDVAGWLVLLFLVGVAEEERVRAGRMVRDGAMRADDVDVLAGLEVQSRRLRARVRSAELEADSHSTGENQTANKAGGRASTPARRIHPEESHWSSPVHAIPLGTDLEGELGVRPLASATPIDCPPPGRALGLRKATDLSLCGNG